MPNPHPHGRYAICFRQGDGSHRYMQFPPSKKNPQGFFFRGYQHAFKYEEMEEAEDIVASLVEDFETDSRWLGQCSLPFVTDQELNTSTDQDHHA